jgi:hypothetical protein
VLVSSESPTDWTWLLCAPVKEGEPTPIELWFFYHANTLMPMWRKEQEQEQQNSEAA